MAKKQTGTSLKPIKRKPIPPSIKDAVLMEAGYKCGNPRCYIILAPNILEDHHIKYVSNGGGNEISNLLALCPLCHTLHHSGVISQEAIRHWKGMIVALNHALGHRSMDLLLLLHRIQGGIGFWFSADGVLQFAGLIAAGLVSFGSAASGGLDNPTSGHQLRLSPRGMMLTEAWLAGDEERYREAMSKTI